MNIALPNALACWGDSETAGLGATGGNAGTTNYPARLMRTGVNVGRAVANLGVVGNTTKQIVDRMLRDRIRGRDWTCILWPGRNDINSTLPVNYARDLIMPDIARAVANLSHPRFLLLSCINRQGTDTTEQQGTSGYNQIIALNNAMATTYPNNYLDIRAQLVAGSIAAGGTGGTDCITTAWTADDLHLNDAGCGGTYLGVSAFLAAKGW